MQNLSALNVIHITGTKGKGSTAAFTESLLRSHFTRLNQPIKIGLYTSPHIITERDRIRVNFDPVSEDLFASSFFEIWHALRCGEPGYRPGYLQLLALLSVHIFKKVGVDMAIYEVHAGGRKDATNIFEQPVACGFSRIGLDHADLLGPGVDSIAWHKSGIMKKGRPAFSVAQDEVPDGILKAQADDIGADLVSVDTYPALPTHPNVSHQAQKDNASLAIALANQALADRGSALSADDIERGITKCAWPGRFQHLQRDGLHWFLDSAHNDLSIPVAVSWFTSTSTDIEREKKPQKCKKILIFGHSSDRSTEHLVDVLLDSCASHDVAFDQVILSSYNRYGMFLLFYPFGSCECLLTFTRYCDSGGCDPGTTKLLAVAEASPHPARRDSGRRRATSQGTTRSFTRCTLPSTGYGIRAPRRPGIGRAGWRGARHEHSVTVT